MIQSCSDSELRGLLGSVKRIAIVGAKDVSGQPVNRVGRYLLGEGFCVLPVHPKRRSVWGLKAAPSLAELEGPVDMVLLFRASDYCPGHAREVLSLERKPLCFWMQEGIRSKEARELLAPLGVKVVEDACVMVEHARLFGRAMFTEDDEKRLAVEAPVDDSEVFTCQMCGECCRGIGGIVVSPTDLARITKALGIGAEEFRSLYGEERGGKLQIRVGDDGRCIFFKDGEGCSVHAGKPDVCRAWPFFRGNIVDPESLAMAKDFCPGIRKDATHELFAKEGVAYLKKHRLLAKDSDKGGWAVFLREDELS